MGTLPPFPQRSLDPGGGVVDSAWTTVQGIECLRGGRWWVGLTVRGWHAFEAQFPSLAGNVPDFAVPIPCLILLEALLHVLHPLCERGLYQPGQLVGGGRDGLGRPHPRLQTPEEGPQGSLRMRQRAGGQPQRRGHPVGPGADVADLILPADLLCCGHSPSQLQKCFTLGNRLRSGPISLRIVNAVVTSIPSIAVRSTALIRCRGARAGRRTQTVFQTGSGQCLSPVLWS